MDIRLRGYESEKKNDLCDGVIFKFCVVGVYLIE